MKPKSYEPAGFFVCQVSVEILMCEKRRREES